MNFEDSTLRQHDAFRRSMPRHSAATEQLTSYAAVATIESQVDLSGGNVCYHFTASDEARHGCDSLTDSILAAIQTQNTDLRLYKITGQFPNGFMSYQKRTIYRLSSSRNHCYIEFYFRGSDENLTCRVLIFLVEPSHQGSGHNVRDFLINRFAKTIFNLPRQKVSMVSGTAQSNQYPLRSRRDWREMRTRDGKTTRLVRLYELCGFTTIAELPNEVFLLPHNALGKPKRISPARKPVTQPHVSICAGYAI
jgi:hypothetical protein